MSEQSSSAGEILVSGTTYDYVKNKVKWGFEDLGVRTLKNLAEPARIYRVTGTLHMSVIRTVPATDKSSIAVLPFVNMSADPEQEFFADGLTEDIITALSRISGLRVIARASTFTQKRPTNVKQVSLDLGVR